MGGALKSKPEARCAFIRYLDSSEDDKETMAIGDEARL